MWTIGIDIGTTTISAVVMSTETKKAERAYTITNDSFFETENAWERVQNPQLILEKSVKLLDEILESYPQTDVIGLTGQMHGIVYLDKDGRHVSPLYTWQDGSGNQSCVGEQTICEYAEECFGEKLYTGYGLATYLYHTKVGRVPETATKICTIMDYLGMVMTGRKEPLIHVSNAASLGLFDVEKGVFQTELLRRLGGDADMLPEVADKVECLGDYKGILVSTAIGDNQASFLGTVEDIEDTLLINMGTGGQISLYVPTYNQIKGMETRPFLEKDYLLVGSSLCGGRAYALLERFFRSYAEALGCDKGEQYGVMEHILNMEDAQTVTDELAVVTTFSGTREEPDKRGSISGIGIENFTPAALIRGVLEGMAQELYEMYRLAEAGLERLPKKLLASGNGLRRNHRLQKIMEKRFAMPLQLSQQTEEAACGAGRAGMRMLSEQLCTREKQNSDEIK